MLVSEVDIGKSTSLALRSSVRDARALAKTFKNLPQHRFQLVVAEPTLVDLPFRRAPCCSRILPIGSLRF